jgi:hypothetical protein
MKEHSYVDKGLRKGPSADVSSCPLPKKVDFPGKGTEICLPLTSDCKHAVGTASSTVATVNSGSRKQELASTSISKAASAGV